MTVICCVRLVRSSRSPTTPSSSPPSSGQRSRSYWHVTAGASCTSSTTHPLSPVTNVTHTPTVPRPARSWTTPRTTCATGSPSLTARDSRASLRTRPSRALGSRATESQPLVTTELTTTTTTTYPVITWRRSPPAGTLKVSMSPWRGEVVAVTRVLGWAAPMVLSPETVKEC